MTEDGLPQNSVLAIAQTRDGYLWLATLNGLVRFDGLRFTVFDKNNTPALQTSRFHDLYEDADGVLWIGTNDSGILRYQNGTFTAITQAQGLPHNQIRQIQHGVDGKPLIITENGAFWSRNGGFSPYEFGNKDSETQFYLAPSGTHWVLDKQGLHAHKDGRTTDYVLPIPPDSLLGTRMYEDRQGNVWVATASHGVFRIKDGQVIDYTRRLQNKARNVFAILEDRDGALWFSTLNSGLIHFRDAKGEEARVYTMADGLSSNAIRGLCQDREGTLWVGTGGGGLIRITRRFITGYSEAEGLAGNIAHAVLADHTGAVWVATHAGLSRISKGVVTNYMPDQKAGHLPLRGLQALYEDRSGRLWLGGWDGLCFFQNGVFSPAQRQINGTVINVWAMHEDRQGVLWVGTHFGLMKFKDGAHLYTFTTKDGLPKDTIRTIHEDRQGVLWFGTEGGLVKFEGNRFTTFTTQNGLVNNRLWSIYEDADGVLWLGTFDGGLSRFKDGRFTNYTKANGLFDNGVFQILEDGRGNLWMSCFRGLYRVRRQQLNDFADGKISAITSTAFGKADGMLNSDCNGGRQPSGIKTSDGQLWFTTLKGVAVVRPDEIPTNPAPPPPLVEEVSLDGTPVNLRAGWRVAPGQSNLEIQYTALSFLKAEQLRFRYKLIGQDHDWIEAGTRRTANYAHLQPGQYTFVVMAANSDGIWSQSQTQLQVEVLPAFYQTWWFRLLTLLSFAGVVGLIFKWRLTRIRRAQQEQIAFSRRLIESQEAERKRLASELHDSLGQDLLVIKNWIAYGQATLQEHDPARETLDEIATATENAIESCREITYSLRPHQLDHIGLTEALRAMVNKVAQASGLQIELKLDDLAEALPKEAEINLFRIVQEGLTNIVKHARATKASVTVHRELIAMEDQPLTLKIEIRDNGCGFDPLMLRQLPSGLGLSGIVERAQMLGGIATIQSTPGLGTTIVFTLPITNLTETFAPENFAEESRDA